MARLRALLGLVLAGFLCSAASCRSSRGTLREGLYYVEPGAPPACASDVHCVAGRCADTCR